MKRITAILICILSLAMVAECFADFDLSGMTYDELVALKDQINLAIWNSDEWQEVEVPQGVWKVGEDIPAGKWTIKALPEGHTSMIVGTEVRNGGTDVKSKTHQLIKDEGYRSYDAKEDVTSWTVELTDDDYVQIEYGSAVFTPYSGKPSLGFK